MRVAFGALTLIVMVATSSLVSPAPSALAATTRVVPDQYATVQTAVNAASAGDTIKIKSGTFSEQVTIGKSLHVIGAGASATTIHAPATLVNGSVPDAASIIEINNGATVEISGLSVSGPAATSCAVKPLDAGIRVVGGATLNLHDARVSHIHETPKHRCNFNGTGVAVGALFFGEVGHATIQRVTVDDYESIGIQVFTPGSDLLLTDSIMNANIAPGEDAAAFGVVVGDGAVAHVLRNVILGNRCKTVDLFCGPDPISQLQTAGIGTFLPPGPGTEFANNVIAGNDVGIYLAFVPGCCLVHDNVLLNNSFFGIAIQDGANTVSNDLIVGGQVGVGSIADAVDTTATLQHERIFGASVARIKRVECCGFHASVIER